MNEEDKKKIAKIMKRHNVLVGYLFGSAARGKMGPHSDIDVAVFFDGNEIPKEKQLDKKLKISSEITKAFCVQNTDVINLNTATNPVIRYEAVLKGEPLVIKDFSARALLTRQVLRQYEETKHLRETSYRILREQAKSGAFGRAPASPTKNVTS